MPSNGCSKCRGIGWLVEERNGLEAAIPCPECHRSFQLQDRLQRAQIPPRYFSRGFKEYSFHHPSQREASKKAIDYVESFPDVPRGLLLVGPCGVGKTHLSVAMLKAILNEQEVTGRFVDEAELLRRLQYSYGPDSPDTEREVLVPLMEVDLLVWDDLGTGRPTDWVRETLRMVMNHRYTSRRHTVISTNWPLSPASGSTWSTGRSVEQTLQERISRRLYSRIMEMCEVVEIEGPDFRMEIHKPSLDSRTKPQPHKSKLRLPAGWLRCPKCSSKQVRVLDQAGKQGDGPVQYEEFSCLCRGCSEHFLARFFPGTAKVEYPVD